MNGLLVWILIIGVIILVAAAVFTLLRGRIDPP